MQSLMLSQLFKHEMTGGKDGSALQRTAEIKLCLLQRPAVWCLAVEGPCAGSPSVLFTCHAPGLVGLCFMAA